MFSCCLMLDLHKKDLCIFVTVIPSLQFQYEYIYLALRKTPNASVWYETPIIQSEHVVVKSSLLLHKNIWSTADTILQIKPQPIKSVLKGPVTGSAQNEPLSQSYYQIFKNSQISIYVQNPVLVTLHWLCCVHGERGIKTFIETHMEPLQQHKSVLWVFKSQIFPNN